MLVVSVDKMAVKAALARMVAVQGVAPVLAAESVQHAVERLGLQIGDLHSSGALLAYASGVQGRSANRKWANYKVASSLSFQISTLAGNWLRAEYAAA